MRLLIGVCLILTINVLDANYPGLPEITKGSIWPQPVEVEYKKEALPFNPSKLNLTYTNGACSLFNLAFKNYDKNFFFPIHAKGKEDRSLVLNVNIKKNCPKDREFPTDNMDESYSLTIGLDRIAHIEANEVWGALRGLESFSQVIIYNNERDTYEIRTLIVKDKPRFKIRGFLIDTSRHYLSVNLIKRQLDLMAINKYNILHWHIVDEQSFPYVSKKFPQLSNKGAYSKRHVYKASDVTSVMMHAKMRGIMVMPEFDTPGHMGSWYGQPDLLTECFDEKGKKIELPFPNLIDPSNPENFKFLFNFFSEVKSLFKSTLMHLGGDEVEFWQKYCWFNNPKIQKFMLDKGFGNETKLLENYYISQLSSTVATVDKNWKQLYWQEVFDFSKVPQNSIVHIWKGGNLSEIYDTMARVTQEGYDVILSSCWYLNYVHYGPDWRVKKRTRNTEGIALYECDPQGFNGTQSQKDRVIGGIAALWGEFIDASNLEPVSWPRGSAVAEKLWSPRQFTVDAAAQLPRLREHRCRMVERGFNAAPFDGADFCENELLIR
uniref:Beta-hexosaminidase n=1 Tax=Rhabditophanes sp. KR3021 TaxID=114890 RepID=A0AC35TY24_9BILA